VPVPEALVGRSTWVAHGPTQIHLWEVVDPAVPREGHVAVVCTAYAQTQAALTAAGHAVGEHEAYWGAPRCFTRSPGGHLVEVMAAPPPAS
jgi:hypothetical protein